MGTGILTPTDYANGGAERLKRARGAQPTVPESAVKPIAASGDIADAFARELDSAEPAAGALPIPVAVVVAARSMEEAAVRDCYSKLREAEVQVDKADKRVVDREKDAANAKRCAADRLREAGELRVALGNALAALRKQWPERGPTAKGWGEFLAREGIDRRTALRYMELAGYVESLEASGQVSDTEPDAVSETPRTPTYVEAGIVKRPRTSDADARDATGEDLAGADLPETPNDEDGELAGESSVDVEASEARPSALSAPAPLDLRHGSYRDVFAGVGMVDVTISDNPFSPRVHASKATRRDGVDPAGLAPKYAPWTEDDVRAWVEFTHEITRGWICALTDDVSIPWYRAAYQRVGRKDFAPVPCVIPGMSVRQQGDGPSSWAVYLMVGRLPSGGDWGTTDGAYFKKPEDADIHSAGPAGGGRGKPLWLMRKIVKDYSRAGDLVGDTCAGWGSTLISALALGRRAVGSEIDAEAISEANRRAALARAEPITTPAPGANP